ncbi:hypothetical protein D9M68_716490 [compost metagenome]
MPSCMDLPASTVHSAISSARLASSRSARRSRMRARLSMAVAFQRGQAALNTSSAWAAWAALANCALPTTLLSSYGQRTSCAVPGSFCPLITGAACH